MCIDDVSRIIFMSLPLAAGRSGVSVSVVVIVCITRVGKLDQLPRVDGAYLRH